MRLLSVLFENYTHVDIINTGVYDCYSEEFMEKAMENAKVIDCQLSHVEGSNYLLEKLVSGIWDHQFLVVEPGKLLNSNDFVNRL